MIRFWSRITHQVRQERASCSFIDLLTSPTYTTYADRFEKARQEAWFRVWNSELEQIDYISRRATFLLNAQLHQLADSLCSIASPVRNSKQDQVNKAQNLASVALREWNVSFEQLNRVLESATFTTSSFTEVALHHQKEQEALKEALQKHHLTFRELIQTTITAPYFPRLGLCMNQLLDFHHNLCFYQAYLLKHVQWLVQITSSESVILEKQLKMVDQLKQRCGRLLQINHPVPTDYMCAICLDMLQEPVTLGCDHTFCRVCLQRYFCQPCEQKRPSESFFGSVRHAVYCECYALDAWDRKAACPLCRHLFAATTCRFDSELSRYLSLYFPQNQIDKRECKETLYNRIQRWSYRITQQEGIEIDILETRNNLALMARRSWII